MKIEQSDKKEYTEERVIATTEQLSKIKTKPPFYPKTYEEWEQYKNKKNTEEKKWENANNAEET